MPTIFGPDGKPYKVKRKKKKGGKDYMFAIEGQIYEPPKSLSALVKELDGKQMKELVYETTRQVIFLRALKKMLPMLHSRQGIHPNVKNLSIFEESDKERLIALENTLEWFEKRKPPVVFKGGDVEKLVSRYMNKMFDTIHEIPAAWNKDGTLKPEYAKEYLDQQNSNKVFQL